MIKLFTLFFKIFYSFFFDKEFNKSFFLEELDILYKKWCAIKITPEMKKRLEELALTESKFKTSKLDFVKDSWYNDKKSWFTQLPEIQVETKYISSNETLHTRKNKNG